MSTRGDIGYLDGIALWRTDSPNAPADAVTVSLSPSALADWDRFTASHRGAAAVKLDACSAHHLAADLAKNATPLYGAKC